MLFSSETFTPHTYEDLRAARAFPDDSIPEAAYNRMCADYSAMADIDVRRIIYASDGLKVTGIMALPQGDTPSPLVVYNRGGNREFGKLTVYAVMRQMVPLARAGYIVLASNYRGNDGGEGTEEFGGADVNDVLNLLVLGRANPRWDGVNSYLLGHSRGGMMNYLAIKRGANVNAAVSIAAPSDLFASGRERAEIENHVHRELILTPQEQARAAEYEKRSAVFWPEKIAGTPILLQHGDNDIRVDITHSLRLAEALRAIGAKHKLVVYPGGNHALIRDWNTVLQETLDWFQAHRRNA